MHFKAPVEEIFSSLRVFGLQELLDDKFLPHLDCETAESILIEAGKFASDRIAPLNQIKIIAHKEKSEWELVQKYNIGTKRN